MAFQVFALLLIIVGMMLFLVAYRLRQASRPGGHIDYADEQYQITMLKGPLVDTSNGLAGQPDSVLHILETNESVPIILLDVQAPADITYSVQMKAVLLCRLTENAYSQAAPYAVLRYTDVDVNLERSDALEAGFDTLISDMRRVAQSDADGACPYDIPGPTPCEHCII